MIFKKSDKTYFIRLERGEKIIETLKNFCSKNRIKCGYLSGIGALDEVELAHYVVENRRYTSKTLKQPLEITNMSGNITTMNKEVYLHCHITLSDEKMKAIAGHLKEGIVSATCEIALITLKGSLERRYDSLTGLNLMCI
ncbi:DNA-binding protein [Candidatus Woesearchaeota archaeon]|nr:DNA-binding protein [Candidatus Woesearchaeota archaeon]